MKQCNFLIKSVTVVLGFLCIVQLPGSASPPLADNEVILHFKEVKPPPSPSSVYVNITVRLGGEIDVQSSHLSINKYTVWGWLDAPGAAGAWKDKNGNSLIDNVMVETDGELRFDYAKGICQGNIKKKTQECRHARHPQADPRSHAHPKTPICAEFVHEESKAYPAIIGLENSINTITSHDHSTFPIKFGYWYHQSETKPGKYERVSVYFDCSADSIRGGRSNTIDSIAFGSVFDWEDGKLFLGVNGVNWRPETPPGEGYTNETAGDTRYGLWSQSDFNYSGSYVFIKEEALKHPFHGGDSNPLIPWSDKSGAIRAISPFLEFYSGDVMRSYTDHTTKWVINHREFSVTIAEKLKAYLDAMKNPND